MKRKLLHDLYLSHACHHARRRGKHLFCPRCQLEASLSKRGLTFYYRETPSVQITVESPDLIPLGA